MPIMAWKRYLLLLLTAICLSNSQDELETTSPQFPWIRMTSNGIFLENMERTNTKNQGNHGPPITEDSVKELGKLGLMTTEVARGELKDAAEMTFSDTISTVTLTEDYLSGISGTTPKSSSSGWSPCYPNLFYIVGPLICTVSFIGFVSNCLCIFVFWPDRNKSATTVLLLQLAVVDNLILVWWTFIDMCFFSGFYMDPPSTIAKLLSPYNTYIFIPIGNMIMFVSAWLVVYITIQRYVAVCHPHKMRLMGSVKVAWIQLAMLITVGMLFNSPRFFERYLVVDNGKVSTVRTWLGQDDTYKLYYRVIGYFLMHFIIPLTLLVFFTVTLIRAIRKSMKLKMEKNMTQTASMTGPATTCESEGEKASKDKARKSQTDDMTLALILVDVVFICCQIMPPVWRLFGYILPQEMKGCGTAFDNFGLSITFGTYINSSINFFIFCLCGRGFRSLVFQRIGFKSASVQPAKTLQTGAASQWGARRKK